MFFNILQVKLYKNTFWFLYDNGLRHERVKISILPLLIYETKND